MKVKKIISIILVVMLCISVMPLTASAAKSKSINFNNLPEDYELVVNSNEVVTITDTVKLASVDVKGDGTLILDGANLIIEGGESNFFLNYGIVKATENGGSITVNGPVDNINIIMGLDITCESLYNFGTLYQCNCTADELYSDNIIGECNLMGGALDLYLSVVKDSTVDFEKYIASSNRTYQYKISPYSEEYAAGEVVPLKWTPVEDYADEITFISWEITNLVDNTLVEVADINSPDTSFVMPEAPVEINAICSAKLSGKVYVLGEVIDENNLSGEGWSYNPDTQVLTFDNFEYEGSSYHPDFDFGHVVFSDINELTVTGNAKINLVHSEDEWYANYVFASNGDIIFDNANIEITTDCGVGIDCYESIKIINNSNIIISAGTACSDEAIYTSKDIIISDSTVKATSVGLEDEFGIGGSDTLDAGRDIILNNAIVDAVSTDDGFDARYNVIINDSKVTVKSLFDDGEGGTLGDEGIEARLIEINGNSVIKCTVDDNGLCAPEIHMNGGKVILDSPATDTPYPAIDGILHYNGGSIEVKSTYCITTYPIQISESIDVSILTSANYDGSNASFDYDNMSFLNCKYMWLNSIEATVDTVKSGTKLSKVGIDGTVSDVEGSFRWVNPDEEVDETGNYMAIFVPDDKGIVPIRVSVEVIVCSHICHNDSIIARTFWAVMQPIFRMFGIQSNCECGAPHFD